jgi:hypothetical protein
MVRDAPICPDEVQAFRGSAIGFIDGVVHLFDQHGNRQVQI